MRCAMDAQKILKLHQSVRRLKSEAIRARELVEIITELHDQAGYGENVREFITAEGIHALVSIATTGWPADGRVADSQHLYDQVIEAEPYDPELRMLFGASRVAEHKWRSPRRSAISALASMVNYPRYVDTMDDAGFFKPEALPLMLEQSFAFVDYNLHNKGLLWEDAEDQIQAIAIDLLGLAENAIDLGSTCLPLGRHLAQHTAMKICKMYQDPQTSWVAKCRAQRDQLRNKMHAQGRDPQDIEDAATTFKDRQQQLGEASKYGCGKYLGEDGGVDYYFCRFFSHIEQFSTPEELLTLTHEGGLISKLKGNILSLRQDICPTIDSLLLKWTAKACSISRELYKRIQAEESQALTHRQSGNTAFKEGRLADALAHYYDALGHNPEDYALFNNISLTALKMGDPHQAMLAAHEAVSLQPTVAKSWVRLGDAFRDLGRWQLAHLAYTCATELDPADADMQARKAEARSQLSEVWDIDDVPNVWRELVSHKMLDWMGIPRKHARNALKMGTKDMYELLFMYPVIRESYSRSIAAIRLKNDIDTARALAVAIGLVTPAQLPPSCSGLKRVEQLPRLPGYWSLSWTDTPDRHKRTGLVRHTLTLMANNGVKARAVVLGTPGLAALKRVLLEGMLCPKQGAGGRPFSIHVAHRMFPLFDPLAELCSQYGIIMVAETEAEAHRCADDNDTDWQGYNNAGRYIDLSDSEEISLGEDEPDPRNGHLQDASTAARGSDQHSKQHRKQHSKQRGAATRGVSKSSSSRVMAVVAMI